MKEVKIIAHCLFQNEGRFIWYAINSVLPYVDQVIVWDMSSVDNSDQVIRTIKSEKISYKKGPAGSPERLTEQRQKMLQATSKEYTWVMVLDGDEIWPQKSIEVVTNFARQHPEFESIVVRTHNLVGDIYHTLPQSSGKYQLAGQRGHLALRLMNLKKIPGLQVKKPHGTQGYFDKNNLLVQNRDPHKIKFFNLTYHHATHLPRSTFREGDFLVPKRKQKMKHELGEKIPPNEIPEVFFISGKPKLVPDVTQPAPLSFWLSALIQTLPRRLKRVLFPTKVGY